MRADGGIETGYSTEERVVQHGLCFRPVGVLDLPQDIVDDRAQYGYLVLHVQGLDLAQNRLLGFGDPVGVESVF